MINRATRTLLMVFLALTILSVAVNAYEAASAQAGFDFSVSLGGYSLSVAPNRSGYDQVTVVLVSGSSQTVNLTSEISPQDGEVSAYFAQPSGNPSFITTLVVNALAAPPGKTYTITVTGTAQGLTRQAPSLSVTISCPQGPCPKLHVDWTDKTSYSQGESIQFRGSGFPPTDIAASCLTTNNDGTATCQNQASADAQGDVSGSMLVTSKVPPGQQQFYLKDLTNDQQSSRISLTILQASPILTTTYVGQGSVSPSCPSGCVQSVGEPVNVTAIPGPGWTFSGWNMTGVTCSGGLSSNPCTFTMPNNQVSANANFFETQLLTTTYTGQGAVSPYCPSGCQVVVGSMVTITSTPSPGWVVSGYHLTSGVTCGPQSGFNTCAFTMPNLPVSFQVTFAETTITSKTTTTSTYVVTTPVTSTSIIANTATQTATIITESTTQVPNTQTTTVLFSTSGTIETQSQYYAATQLSTVTSTTTSITWVVVDPTVELGLAAILLIASLFIGVNVIKRSPKRGAVLCPSCGFKNSYPGKYCVGCGEPLKRT